VENPIRATAPADLKVIETFGWNGSAFPRLERHLARMQATCGALGIAFDIETARRIVRDVQGPPARVRLTCDLTGGMQVETTGWTAADFWTVAISEQVLDPSDPWLRHKTSVRKAYDLARRDMPQGVDEVILLNNRGEVCEGSISSVFAEIGGRLFTPALDCGLLPGVLRAEMLEDGRCSEAVLSPADLRRGTRLFVGNSLRGLIGARWAASLY
jgi:4-amino-4-deoxychorismate lyase